MEPNRDPRINPWVPMKEPIDLKHLGKMGEELCEAGAATFRCIIQGIGESEPVTGKLNSEWLEEELADVEANIDLVKKHFHLDVDRMNKRKEKKKKLLSAWHNALITKKEMESVDLSSLKDLIKKRYSWSTIITIFLVLFLFGIFTISIFSVTKVFR